MNRMNHPAAHDALPEKVRRERFSWHLTRFLTLLAVVMVMTVSALVFLIWLISLFQLA